ncbi:hypothetical protein MMC16_004261 [Acarospora aff. strigata]|nr:hypothetical protein [Acarospora aff. strigata]
MSRFVAFLLGPWALANTHCPDGLFCLQPVGAGVKGFDIRTTLYLYWTSVVLVFALLPSATTIPLRNLNGSILCAFQALYRFLWYPHSGETHLNIAQLLLLVPLMVGMPEAVQSYLVASESKLLNSFTFLLQGLMSWAMAGNILLSSYVLGIYSTALASMVMSIICILGGIIIFCGGLYITCQVRLVSKEKRQVSKQRWRRLDSRVKENERVVRLVVTLWALFVGILAIMSVEEITAQNPIYPSTAPGLSWGPLLCGCLNGVFVCWVPLAAGLRRWGPSKEPAHEYRWEVEKEEKYGRQEGELDGIDSETCLPVQDKGGNSMTLAAVRQSECTNSKSALLTVPKGIPRKDLGHGSLVQLEAEELY